MLPLILGADAATLPHCPEVLQETAQVTPMPDESPVTVAVTGTVPVAGTEFPLADTDTVMMGGGVFVDELPPQPVIIMAEARARIVQGKETLPFMRPSKCRQSNGHYPKSAESYGLLKFK